MSSAGHQVLATLRQMIASGELAAGQAVAELPTAERLKVSRMPVRMAFRTLEQEGLLCKRGQRGYQVRGVSAEEIAGAVEVRGVLEGLAARQAAERGLDRDTRRELLACLSEGDRILDKGAVDMADVAAYHGMNLRLHQLLVQASGNPAIELALKRNDHLPFASVSALAVDERDMPRVWKRFFIAHQQHHALLDALDKGQGARAEGIMREHAQATLQYADNAQRRITGPGDAA